MGTSYGTPGGPEGFFSVIDENVSYIPDDEVALSAPFAPDYRLFGENGSAIISRALELMAQREARHRRLRPADYEARRLTVEVLLANIIVSALHSINPTRSVAVTFHKNSYPPLGLSHAAMILARDTLLDAGLIAYRVGFYQKAAGKDFREYRRVSRIRASDALRALFNDFCIDQGTVRSRPKRLIQLNRAEESAGPEPTDVTKSESVLAAINTRIEAAALAIPEEVWTRMRVAAQGAGPDEDPARFYQGDQTAKALRRVFTYHWQKGGRLYGGWWQGLTENDRRLLMIDGEATVEIDFRNLHPVLLYRLTDKQLNIDPYHLPPYSRALCKETFQRLMNRSPKQGGANIRRPKVHHVPRSGSYANFICEYKKHLADVGEYFGKGIGLLLQREDSDLALEILEQLHELGIVALPVHDSFIVKVSDQVALDATMRRVFASRYGVDPELKASKPLQLLPEISVLTDTRESLLLSERQAHGAKMDGRRAQSTAEK
jgi:hypothetical protein